MEHAIIIIIIIIIKKDKFNLPWASFKDRLQSRNSTREYRGECSYRLYDWLKSWVFKCFLKVHSVFAEVTHAGRVFQRRAAATPKARSPAVGQ